MTKDLDGTPHAAELTELAPDVQAVFGAAGVAVNGLLNDEDLITAADSLEPGSSAALIVWEDLWAKRFTEAVRDSAGVLVERRTIPTRSLRRPTTTPCRSEPTSSPPSRRRTSSPATRSITP